MRLLKNVTEPITISYRILYMLAEMQKNSANLFQTDIKWKNVISITILHLITIYSLLTFPYLNCLYTVFFQIIYGSMSGFGVTAAAHRLWSHKAYKAKLPLRILYIIFYTMAGQNTVFDWVRDHRVHHKYSETIADPHDSNRGFFFSHVGWLMLKKHPEVIKKGKQIDMSDMLEDPVVRFQTKYFVLMMLLIPFIIPIAIPCYFWNETIYCSIMANLARYCIVLNFTWSVNSAAHLFGTRPYNRNIEPRENIVVSVVALGEGWHNYHHTFPWDYKAGEFGKWNVTAFWIEIFAKIGLAYDLKKPTNELIYKYIKNNGDGTYKLGREVENLTN